MRDEKTINVMDNGKRYDTIFHEFPPMDIISVWISPAIFRLPVFARNALESVFRGKNAVLHHNSSWLSIEFILEGEFLFHFARKNRTLSRGCVGFLHRNKTCGFETVSPVSRKLTLILSGNQLSNLLDQLRLTECEVLPECNQLEMERRFREIMWLLTEKRPGSEFYMSEKVYSLLLYLSDLWNGGQSQYPEELSQSLEYIERSFREPIFMRDIAEAAGISVSTLIRLFQKHMDTHPSGYLIKYRMNYAATLLRTGTPRIKEVACDSGFSNPLYFSTAFRQYFGMSPGEYRKIYGKNESPPPYHPDTAKKKHPN